MSSVQPRGAKWQLRVTHKLLPKPFFQTFDSQVEAQNYGDRLEALLANGVVPQDLLNAGGRKVASPLLYEIIRDYLLRGSPAPSTKATLDLVTAETMGVRVAQVTFLWAEAWIKALKAKPKKPSPGTIRKRVQALARVLDWHFVTEQHVRGNAREQLPVNVLRLLPDGYSLYPDNSKKDTRRDLRLGPGDEAKILAALAGEKRADRERPWGDDPGFKLLFELIIDTGLRLREAYWLRVDQIDAQRRLLRVDGTKGHRQAVKPRVVPISSTLRDKLVSWYAKRPDEVLVFPFWNGTPEDLTRCTSRLSNRFATLFDYAGVPHFTEHDLRHEACCRWVTMRGPGDQGWLFNEVEICKIMGWSDTSILMRYASLRGEDLSSRLL